MRNDRRPVVGLLNTLQASGDNVHDDGDAEHTVICEDNTADPVVGLFEPIPYGATIKVESFDSVAEEQQRVNVGGETLEVITAETRYKIEIGNDEDRYETHEQTPGIHAYTTPVALSGDADVDRLNVYSALADKVNAFAGNNASASVLYEIAYTLGGATGNDELPTGTVITQETSGVTAVVAAKTITSGTFGTGDAAGTIQLAEISDTDALLDGAKTWSWATSTLAHTVSTTVPGTGISIVDDAGYFISKLGRNGANWVGATQGFSVAETIEVNTASYAMGIGSVMAQLKPAYEFSKQQVVNHGLLEYEYTLNKEVDIAKTYRKYVITISGGDQDAIDYQDVHINPIDILYVDESNGTNLGTFDSALLAALAK